MLWRVQLGSMKRSRWLDSGKLSSFLSFRGRIKQLFHRKGCKLICYTDSPIFRARILVSSQRLWLEQNTMKTKAGVVANT